MIIEGRPGTKGRGWYLGEAMITCKGSDVWGRGWLFEGRFGTERSTCICAFYLEYRLVKGGWNRGKGWLLRGGTCIGGKFWGGGGRAGSDRGNPALQNNTSWPPLRQTSTTRAPCLPRFLRRASCWNSSRDFVTRANGRRVAGGLQTWLGLIAHLVS